MNQMLALAEVMTRFPTIAMLMSRRDSDLLVDEWFIRRSGDDAADAVIAVLNESELLHDRESRATATSMESDSRLHLQNISHLQNDQIINK
jgi:hypothetical protein